MRRHLAILFLLLIIAASACHARKVNVRRGDRASSARVPAAVLDTVAACDSAVVFSGYDKPLRSTRESMFLTNRTGRHLWRIAFTLAYYDMSGRLIHKISRNVSADVPSGESRQLTFPSWDRQQSFYFHLSRKPKTSGATPYRIAVRADTLFVGTCDSSR